MPSYGPRLTFRGPTDTPYGLDAARGSTDLDAAPWHGLGGVVGAMLTAPGFTNRPRKPPGVPITTHENIR